MALSKRLINKLSSVSSEKLFDGAGKSTIEELQDIWSQQSELENSQSKDCTGGRKFDGGKLQYGLVPPLALRETVKVLTYGAEKYEPDNWRRVPDGPRRYFDAAQRHIWAYKTGEVNDPETNINHLAHAICCLMFMLDLDESEYEL
jgi:hypothetical protein